MQVWKCSHPKGDMFPNLTTMQEHFLSTWTTVEHAEFQIGPLVRIFQGNGCY